MKIILLALGILILCACGASQMSMELSSTHGGSHLFYDRAHENLKIIQDQCNQKKECLQNRGLDHIEKDFCPQFVEYRFASKDDCEQGGEEVLDLVSREASKQSSTDET